MLEDLITQKMKEAGFKSFRQLAVPLGISQEAVRRYGRGESVPAESVIAKLSELLGIKESELRKQVSGHRKGSAQKRQLLSEVGKDERLLTVARVWLGIMEEHDKDTVYRYALQVFKEKKTRH